LLKEKLILVTKYTKKNQFIFKIKTS